MFIVRKYFVRQAAASLVIAAAFFAVTTSAVAQRQFGLNDSTFHVLNADTTIVVGQKKIYFQTNAGLTLHQDFTHPDSDYYIRDFDILDADTWYVLVGSKYIGNVTQLFKTTNGGGNWNIDSSFYNTATFYPNFYSYNSLNQVQTFGDDTVILYVGYYESGIVYSLNSGATWTKWFHNMIVHYQGLFACENGYYLYSYSGDAFQSSMFKFQKHLLFSPDTNGAWTNSNFTSYHPPCYNGTTTDCIFPPDDSLTYFSHYNFFRQYVDTACTGSVSVENPDAPTTNLTFRVAPNPVNDIVTIELSGHQGKAADVHVVNALGQVCLRYACYRNSMSVDVSSLPKGIYLMVAPGHGSKVFVKD